MKQIKDVSDSRFEGFCIYCGKEPNTRDHSPSKILLNLPFTENLPVVPACSKCNQSFSLDEEYLACLIQCILVGSCNPDLIRKVSIRKTLQKKASLKKRIEKNIIYENGTIKFEVELDRIKNVLVKLARGHLKFEQNLLFLDAPDFTTFFSLLSLQEEEMKQFENSYSNFFPEVGSRHLHRQILQKDIDDAGWIIVQEGVYRYKISQIYTTEVRIVINEYLGAHIVWS